MLGVGVVGSATAQEIPGVTQMCADRPIVTGQPLGTPRDQSPVRAGSRSGRPASDLFCMDLLPTARGEPARGVIELGRVPSPFGVTVTPDGHHVYDLSAWVIGLPEPMTLGPYSTYVVWVTTPVLDPVEKLGVIDQRGGRVPLGHVHFDKFLVLVTAEASPEVTERTGPLVLRGRSPSMLMEGHDMLAQVPAALREGHTMHGAGPWPSPPMYPDLIMLPGMMALTPSATPLALETPASVGDAQRRRVVRLPHGGTLDLEAGYVRRTIAGRTVTMLAFNGQHPGPLIQVLEGATIFVNFTNNTPFPTAVHWHGVRLDNRFDGVPGVTQDPVMPGATFRYQVFFKDAGIYWYHPHQREDIQQELGLYGNMLVESSRPDYLSPVNREEVLMLDDLLLDDSSIVLFGAERANFALMGRFGNQLLVNGEPDYALRVQRGDVVRFYLTNASNTRTFNVSFVSDAASSHTELPVKVVGSDIGKFERESWAESVVLAPAERYIVEVRFPASGEYRLVNRVQAIDHRRGTFFPEVTELGRVAVDAAPTVHDHAATFATLHEHVDVQADIDRVRPQFDRPIDHELVLTLEVDSLPHVTEQVMLWDWVYFHPVEWAGTMPDMNWASTGREVRWLLRDPRSGNENHDIDWRFRVGDVVKIRVYNDRDAFHAMQHPLHIHGQRFLMLSQNGVANDNLVWKDTALLPTGSTTDILVELSNPGRWMVHCHIAEHLEAGMMFVFTVQER